MKISIVATLYQSADYIKEFYERTSRIASSIVGLDYEIILVNDGSPDKSLEVAIKISSSDSHVIVVDLSRNFGHHKAMMTGLKYATGERVFLIDSDLEEEPEWLLVFSEEMNKKSGDVVFGVQNTRKGNFFERITGHIFYKTFFYLTSLPLPENLVTARLMTQRYVQSLLLHEEREVFIAGLWYITGFDQHPLIVQKLNTSSTTYTLRKKFHLLINSVTSFSSSPLVTIFYIGLFILFFASIYSFYLVINWTFFSKPLAGWTSVMASIWILGGMMISFIGIIGIYLSKIYSETKKRPYTLVRMVYGK